MNKHEVVDCLTRQSGIKRKDVLLIINGFFDIIINSIEKNESVGIRGFGEFYKTIRKEKKIYSPIAGKKLDIPERPILSFKSSRSINKQLQKEKEGA